jgi:hypothetical protein
MQPTVLSVQTIRDIHRSGYSKIVYNERKLYAQKESKNTRMDFALCLFLFQNKLIAIWL